MICTATSVFPVPGGPTTYKSESIAKLENRSKKKVKKKLKKIQHL